MPVNFNIVTLSYFFSRLSPFIIVCYFILQSLFNQNLKGVFYVAGVLMGCFLNSVITPKLGDNTNRTESCMPIDGIPDLPLGQTILGFTFTYLTYIIIINKLTSTNASTFIIFPILIIADFIWNYKNSCATTVALAVSLTIGCIWGVLWAAIIEKIDPELQFFNGISTREICKRPTTTLYRCKIT